MKNNFIDQVAKTIIEASEKKDSESFILGISGKWGEGKTFFLDRLEETLQAEFYIVKINPWKFAYDKPAFLRHILTQISETISGKTNLDDLRFETTNNRLSKSWYVLSFITVMIVPVLLIISYPRLFNVPVATSTYLSWLWSELVNSTFINNILYLKLLLLYLLTAVLIPPFLHLMSFQKKKSSVSTLDEFTAKLNSILENCDKKVVIYVDDLDRVTPKIAREVLDTMRTFFDKPDLIFVVTGDHSVLERYIGTEILPGKDESEQIEEGRRYLKKIFNIYWRMLPCSEADFGKFIHEYITSHYKTELNDYLKDGSVKFETYLKNYFKKNYRQVIRFIDFTVFSFRAAKAFQESSEGKNKEFISEIFKYPYLLVKILLLQDLCNPLYELLLSDASLLNKLERHISRKEADQFNAEIDLLANERLSTDQKLKCKKIFEECDNFYEGSNLIVKSSKPFLYLSADEEWGDDGGAQPSDFFANLTSGDSKAAESAILMSGKETLKKCGEFAIKSLATLEKTDTFDVPVSTLVKTLSSIPDDNIIHHIVAEELKNIDITYIYNNLPLTDEKRATFYILFWNWLDHISGSDWFGTIESEYLAKFIPMKFAEDFPRIEKKESFGLFSSKVICNWLIQYFKQGSSDRIDKIISLKDKISVSIFMEYFNSISDDLVDLFCRETNDNRDKILPIILACGEDAQTKLIDAIKNMVTSFVPDITNYTCAKVNDGSLGINRIEFEEYLAQGLKGINGPIDPTQFNNAFDLCNNLALESNSAIWESILESHEKYFINWLPQIKDIDYSRMAPAKDPAQKIYSKIIAKIKDETVDPNVRNDYFACIYPDKWLWGKYHQIDMRSLSGMEKFIDKSKIDDLKIKWNNHSHAV